MSNTIIWRDDDVSKDTDLKKFASVHDLFKKYKVKHTIALICKDIEQNPALIKYIKKNQIDVQVHCWEHTDLRFSLTLEDDLIKCKETIQRIFGTTPIYLFPPWNRTSPIVTMAAARSGLRVSFEKMSLSQYLRGGAKEVINFHYWAPECADLEEALIKYTKK